ncbi:hypothetical protein K2173_024367 [Erythroxylum novogranatense]|uniref:Secreted protein n=1 Tax=Erythroxylum novogranatense TaxID=1862640 RepID=A0AAV8SU79_9ROSI|nr:hypothetical protein K2173_024367 [Erythroxylum novogranatense]
MFRFVLLFQHTTPKSVLSGVVANLRGCGREATLSCSGFIFLQSSQWLDGFCSITTYSSRSAASLCQHEPSIFIAIRSLLIFVNS